MGVFFWNDYKQEFHPIVGLNQIFGHTPCLEIQQKENTFNYNIDCLQSPFKKQVLRIDELKVEIVNVNFNVTL